MACNFNPLNPVQSLSDCTVSAGVDIYRMTGSWVLGSGNMTDQMWHATFDVVNKVAGVMAVVTVMLGAASIVAAALRGRVGQAVAAVFRTLLAWPATVIVITLTVDALQVEGQVTGRILGWGGTSSIKVDIDTNGLNIVFALLMGLVLWISALVLALSMGVRMFLIILGVGLSPAVVMVMPLSSMRQGLRKAAAWIVGVILYRPLAAIIIYLTGNLFLTSGSNFMQLIMAVVGAFLAAFAPWVMTAAASRFLPIGVEGLTATAAGGQKAVGKVRSAADKAAATVAAVATGGVSLAGGAAALKSGGSGAAASTAAQEPQAKGAAESASASPTGASSDASPTQQVEGKDGSRKQGSKTQAETAPSSSSSPSGLRQAARADGLGDTITRVGRAPGVYGTRLGTALQAAGSMVNALGGAPLTQMGVATNSTGSAPANPGPGVSPDTVSTSNAPAGGPGRPGRPGQPGEPGQPGTDGHTPNGNMQAGGQAARETTVTTNQTTNQTTVTTNQTSSAPTTPAAASAAGQRVTVDVRTHPDGRRE